MGDIRNANPDHLEQLADKLHRVGDVGAYGELVALLERARQLDVSGELTRLQPLLTWLSDAAEQLRDGAAILRGDSPPIWGVAPSDLMAGYHRDTDEDGEWEWEVIGQEDADAFVELARKDDLTPEDLEQLNQHLEAFAANPDFAAEVVDRIGVEEFLVLTQRVDDAAWEAEEPAVADDLRENLGTVFTNAFRTPVGVDVQAPSTPAYENFSYERWLETPQGQRYEQRVAALNEAGMTNLYLEETAQSPNADTRKGYDVAMDLFENSTTPVDERFFNQMMNRFVEMEREDPSVWSTWRYESDTPGRWDPRNDLTDRFLGIGARNPEAVEVFLDPERNDNLDYFLHRGDDTRSVQPDVRHYENPGFALAIEAASTGLPPGGSPDAQSQTYGHSPANARIAQRTWNTFAEDRSLIEEGGDFESMRNTLGIIASSYIADIQPAANGMSRHAEARFDTAGTAMLLWDLGQDQENYERISAANNSFTHLEIERALTGNTGDVEDDAGDAARRGGFVTGLLTDSHAAAGYAEVIEEDERYNARIDILQQVTDTLIGQGTGAVRHPAGAIGGEAAGVISEITFEQFKQDSAEAAAGAAQEDYGRSKSECQQGVRRSARNVYERSGTNVSWGEIRDEVEDQAGLGFESGASHQRDQ